MQVDAAFLVFYATMFAHCHNNIGSGIQELNSNAPSLARAAVSHVTFATNDFLRVAPDLT
jgi:hypothetical protein